MILDILDHNVLYLVNMRWSPGTTMEFMCNFWYHSKIFAVWNFVVINICIRWYYALYSDVYPGKNKVNFYSKYVIVHSTICPVQWCTLVNLYRKYLKNSCDIYGTINVLQQYSGNIPVRFYILWKIWLAGKITGLNMD